MAKLSKSKPAQSRPITDENPLRNAFHSLLNEVTSLVLQSVVLSSLEQSTHYMVMGYPKLHLRLCSRWQLQRGHTQNFVEGSDNVVSEAIIDDRTRGEAVSWDEGAKVAPHRRAKRRTCYGS
ncbi:predicted protein [Pyrenophora tritici-repentis Pt-1C-BFP]|uniref:Uncharacterized protein n=1 Tax=Pyrenophora tritici-repentis (strain Pt-1C-BFP) TaxID=426418 RepID=B2W222_PYRTR|nr:uncharacterized protein PTRG_03470 [Pyrenophora tritici-repentis Pt-1C-BFP]EDU46308.1 predicted protein [Pyrenophora tritici-repentis Pt-1C-BFP]